jgi:3-dehydroquinate synthase
MPTLSLELPTTCYDIVIESHGLSTLGTRMQGLKLGRKVLVISNPQIYKHYGETTLTTLKDAGFEAEALLLPGGERYKNLAHVQKVFDRAYEMGLERSSTLVALGGGVVGDLTGYAAASWLRGINFVQVPTTLLAMVDASVGGKTGVNHPQGKNLIGAFYQPRLVLMDPQTLETLPTREFRAALSEVIKYGVIWDRPLLDLLESQARLDQYRAITPEFLTAILERSCQSKAEVVQSDEREQGLRAILNYGHTVGHALESLTHYKTYRHGEAVALGMVAAGRIAVALGLWDQDSCERQEELLKKAKLPTTLPETLDIERCIVLTKGDKKVLDGRVRFILPLSLEDGARSKGPHLTKMTDQVSTDLLEEILRGMTLSQSIE